MTTDFLDWLTFLAWMLAPIAGDCWLLWATRPEPDEPEAEPPPEDTIETRARKAHD
jgi:hypothetical protein